LSKIDPPTFNWSFGSGITYERESERESIAYDRYDDFVDRLGEHQVQHACCHEDQQNVHWQQAIMNT
jgi:hypothetical protein